MVNSIEQGLSIPLNALTEKKYVVLAARPVTVAEGVDEKTDSAYVQDPGEPGDSGP